MSLELILHTQDGTPFLPEPSPESIVPEVHQPHGVIDTLHINGNTISGGIGVFTLAVVGLTALRGPARTYNKGNAEARTIDRLRSKSN